MKLKTLIQINEWISHGIAVNRSPDDNLRATPGGMNDGNPHWDDKASFDVNSSNIAENKGWNDDVEDWDAIIEGKDWFCYLEGNDWHNKRSGASIYINEDDKPHKMWIKIKTHGLRKSGDTNESYKERVRKHTNKVARSWMSAAKEIHDNYDLNEVGNPIPVSWKKAFKEALNHPRVKSHIAETGAKDIAPMADPVNFTPRIGESDMNQDISYSAVVLQEDDHKKLVNMLKSQMPQGWKVFGHHMTIKMGALPDNQQADIGKSVTLTAYEIGKSDKAVAVKVKGYSSTNKIAHITLCVNTQNGGKPVDSNKIINWQPLETHIAVKGKVEEIPFKK